MNSTSKNAGKYSGMRKRGRDCTKTTLPCFHPTHTMLLPPQACCRIGLSQPSQTRRKQRALTPPAQGSPGGSDQHQTGPVLELPCLTAIEHKYFLRLHPPLSLSSHLITRVPSTEKPSPPPSPPATPQAPTLATDPTHQRSAWDLQRGNSAPEITCIIMLVSYKWQFWKVNGARWRVSGLTVGTP